MLLQRQRNERATDGDDGNTFALHLKRKCVQVKERICVREKKHHPIQCQFIYSSCKSEATNMETVEFI